MALTGSAKFTWFKTFVNEPSIFIFSLSVIVKDLPREVERLTVPGPVTTPMPPLPNRPIGARSTPGLSPMVQAWPMVQPGVAGQTKAPVLNHWLAVGFEIEPLATRSTCWGRWKPEPVPEGSPLLKYGVSYGPVCQKRIVLRRQHAST